MKNLFIFNIGNSDVQEKLSRIPDSMQKRGVKEHPAARTKGRELWETEYNQFRDDASIKKASDKLELSIISKILKFKEFSSSDSKVILFVTDQEPEHPQDTIYYGKIVEKLLVFNCNIPASSIEIKKINQNPSNIDSMMSYYSNALRKIAVENKSVDVVFASLTGGTPAQNTALLLCGLDIFTDKFRTVYSPENASKVQELTITKNLIKSEVKKQIALLVRQGDYHAALEILYQNSQLFETSSQDTEKRTLPESYQVLQHTFIYAHSRQVFDFKKALKSIDLCLKYSIADKDYFNELKDQVQKLRGNDLLCIAELKENAKYLYNAGHYVDFLGRVFRFFEAVCDYVLLKSDYSCKEFISDKNGQVTVNIRYTDKGKGIIDFIKNNFENTDSVINEKNEIDNKILNNVLRLYLITYIDNSTAKIRLSDYLSVLTVLSSLRNRTIMSHGFKGVSSEEIEKQIKRSYEKIKKDLQSCSNNTDLLKKRYEVFEKALMKDVSGVNEPDICRFLDIVWDKFIEYIDIKEKPDFMPELFYRDLPAKLDEILKSL